MELPQTRAPRRASAWSDGARGTLTLGLPSRPGWRGELLIVAFLALVTIVMTWPIAATLDQATGIRGDYFNNLWNVWWLKHSITEGHTPFWTDHLYYPGGLSLMRHTLSPVNAAMGVVLSTVFGANAAFNVLILLTFCASAWTFSLFARYLTGNTTAAILGGLIYSFNPFHYYYICQINVFSFEWLPLVLLFFVRVYREGGWRNIALAALFTGLLAGSIEYYVVYAAITVGLMLVAGKLLDRDVRVAIGTRRLLIAGGLTALAVALFAFPLLWGTFGPDAAVEGQVTMGSQKRRANDLFGYGWVGGPEVAVVSWATMLGYSTLLLVLCGAKRIVKRHSFWLVVAVLFFVLSLGKTLQVGMQDTGRPLLYELLQSIPGLQMLRKPDRMFYMVQFAVALFAAEAWIGVSAWVARRGASIGKQRAAFAGALVLILFELTGAPFLRFDYGPPAYAHTLRDDPTVETVLELPPMQIDVMNARYNLSQTVHEKKQPLGYCTALALDKSHTDQMQVIVNFYLRWINDQGQGFPKWVRRTGIDRVVFHKRMPMSRPIDESIHQRILYQPFFLVRRKLVGVRQTGQYLDEEMPPGTLLTLKGKLRREFGNPIHEDDEVIVYQVSKDS